MIIFISDEVPEMPTHSSTEYIEVSSEAVTLPAVEPSRCQTGILKLMQIKARGRSESYAIVID